ncbi:uncharacterized protein LOC62_04G005428 [Vanrija pseudolonga]|uniref:Uncharacterized protein n=1 Tax=Vanrija pseudolonga TaxID=143232 RepID=A0AAF1BRA3_9TREE|nr:hypothetical protein LOC62_04G005428 [Vanrija pseudolonga]
MPSNDDTPKSVKRTEYTLSSFLHVLDSIVAGADEIALRSLLGVSKYLDGKARARLYKHIAIQLHTYTGFRGNTYARVEFTSPQSGKRLPGLRWPSPYDPSLTYQVFEDILSFSLERLAANTKVIDLGKDGWSEWPLLGLAEMAELSLALTEVKVVRYCDTLQFHECPLLDHVRSYDVMTLKCPARPTHEPSQLPRSNLVLGNSVGRVIRTIPSASWGGVDLTSFLGPVFTRPNGHGDQQNQAYFVFLPPATETSSPQNIRASHLIDDIYHMVLHYLHPPGNGYQIHLVGFERFSPRFLGLRLSEDSPWSERKIALLAKVKNLMRPFILHQVEQGADLFEGLSDNSFLILDEFQEMVGDELYAQSLWDFDSRPTAREGDNPMPLLPATK